ncbi:nucleotidyltransferase domain-containing protein [Dietzia natronolimnaea]|uniref:nucleotidyltransferase domain-containing protein n=1 Tax=Dietzia natronolimnaea TaxID=161920 RepID=UPI0015FAA1EB|nr:hypothetical protein [Dietzia natronolimnaea]
MGHVSDQLEVALSALGEPAESLPSLFAAVRRSEDALEKARYELRQGVGDVNWDIVAFGSLARHELTPSSDLDVLHVYDHEEPNLDGLSILDNLRSDLIEGVTLSRPGSTNLFGVSVCRHELTRHLGLDRDTNSNMTRRVLFLEESASLINPDLHRELLLEIVTRYLELRNSGSMRVPRVLLNDIVRYWRTVAVDYHAKSSESQQRYSLRYLKLLIPRKLCFLAALAPLHAIHTSQHRSLSEEANFLVQEFSKPTILRLAEFFVRLEESAPGNNKDNARAIFRSLDHFIERSGCREWRDSIERECASDSDPRESQLFGDMRRVGQDVHRAVSGMATSKPMLDFTMEYLVC